MEARDAALAAVRADGLELRKVGEFRADKEVVLAAVQHTGMALCYASHTLQDDIEVVTAAVQQHWMALQYASNELRDNLDIGLIAVKSNGLALDQAGPLCKDNATLVTEAVSNDGRALQYASENLRRDNFIVMEALKSDPEALEFADDELKDSLEVIMPALRRDGATLRFLPEHMRDSSDVALDAVQTCGLAVAFATPKVRADREVIRAAVSKDGLALAYATQELQGDEDIVEAAVAENPLALQYASDRWRCDKDFVKGVVANNGLALEFVSGGLSNDKDVCMEAVSDRGEALIHCSAQMRDDDEIVRTAVSNDGLQLLNVSPRLRQDRNLVMLALSNHPRALAHALEDQIHDKDVVCTAVSHDGMVLVFAPEEMRNHEEVVQAAVSQNGLALEYASPRLREKTETVLAALGQNPDAIHHVLPIVRDDHRMMAFGQERRPCLLEMLSERPRPMALKMALARIRMFVEPLLTETKTSWEDARFVLRKMNSLAELQGAVDDPKAFIDSLNKRQDDMGREWVIATLRFRLEPLAAEQDLWWDEMVPVLKSCSRKELLQAQENGKRFLDTINNKTRGETAQLLAIAKLRRPFSRVLPVGLPWADVVPALHKVETLKELQNAREAPDLLMWKMSNAQQEWPPAVLYSFLRLRPKMEPKLTELVPGVMWEDFVKSLQVLDPMELHQASQSLYRFLQLLEIYPADPPGRWWFIARLRPHIELALDTQGNTWEEAVEMMFEMDPAFDLKPAIHEPLVFCEQLAEGPQHLRWKTTLRPEELKAELRKAAEDG